MSQSRIRVKVIDAGVGNTGNVLRALRHLGAEAELTADPAEVAAATCLVLPGVGAFRPPRERLRGGLEEALYLALDRGAFLLGICVGYQLLFRESSEFGATPGLALLDGTVDVLPANVPLPHIGWNRLIERREHPLLAGLPQDAWVYFVHSFAPRGVREEDVLARAVHGETFAAIAGRGRVFGCQFHPEKSGATGLRLLDNFLTLAAAGKTPPAPPRLLPAAGAGVELLPSIDLRRGEVVRLRQGDDLFRSTYGRDPRRLLEEFAAAGARRVHLVDLDAAFGEAPQRELIAELVRGTSLRVELGGGLRDEAAILWAKEIGCERGVVGSLFLKDPAGFAELARRHPGFLVPALELRGGVPQGAGWKEGAAQPLETLAAALRGLPCPAILVTDVERDGTLGGPNFALASYVARLSGLPAIVSGGVSGLADLDAAAGAPGVAALIVGRAFYEGRFDLAEGFARLARRPDGPTQRVSGLARRLIPCLDVKDGRVVKGLRFENLRDLGKPTASAAAYAAEGADEIVFLDITAAPDGRDTRLDWVRQVAEKVFVPLTVGGGVRSLADAERLLRAGADKVAVNSAAFERPELIGEIAQRFGRQCVVLSVDVRRRPEADGGERPCRMKELDAEGRLPEPRSRWEVVTHGGRKPRGRDALSWIAQGVERGAGEILLTSIDADGTREGYDLELLRAVAARVKVPIVASGGAGTVGHLADGLTAGASAVLAASMFHERTHSIAEVKEELSRRGFPMRPAEGEGKGQDWIPAFAGMTGVDGAPVLPIVGEGADTVRLPDRDLSDVGAGLALPSLADTGDEGRASPAPTPRQKAELQESALPPLRYDERGLLPVIVQEEGSGAVLMLAWANAEAIALTREGGDAWFWSRSRQELWRKGATSGNTLRVVSLSADCDADAVLYRVRASGPACHTGSRSCFASRPGDANPAALELGWLYAVLEERREAAPAQSYTARLLAAGRPRIAQKVGEEAVETVIAALASDRTDGGREALVGEASDLLYHLLVLLLDCGVRPEELTRKLQSRHQGASR